jgi:carboxypeptidase Taq
LSKLAHERMTAPRLGDLIAECETDDDLLADAAVEANVRELRRAYDRAVKLPVKLVTEMSEAASLGGEAWRGAREQSDFSQFEPWMEKQIELNRQKAACWGYPEGGELYDALVDDFEPGMTAAELEGIFGPLRAELTPLIEALAAAEHKPSDEPFRVPLPQDLQHKFNAELLGRLGFDETSGRLDISTHPFSSGLAPADTRLTTRYRDDALLDSIGSTLHEAGHALYEQGLPKQQYVGQPLGEPLGLGVHESQSRLWENHVGRSREFCGWLHPQLQQRFGTPLAGLSADDLYAASNCVQPNLIRVESDEATYHLHIMLRFDLERAMLRGDLQPADLPGAWNERIKSDLGLDVPNDGMGCLQDVHWSMGAIGYFPTYTIGSLYAAQLWEAAVKHDPQLPQAIGEGRFDGLLGWLRGQVHAHGRRYSADELCRRITGGSLSHEPLMRHLDGKLRPLYGLE